MSLGIASVKLKIGRAVRTFVCNEALWFLSLIISHTLKCGREKFPNNLQFPNNAVS